MPHANIWIRVNDWDKWQAVGNKSQFLHAALNINGGVSPERQREPVHIDTVPEAEEAVVYLQHNEPVSNIKTCPNGHILQYGRDKCSMKGCRYSV